MRLIALLLDIRLRLGLLVHRGLLCFREHCSWRLVCNPIPLFTVDKRVCQRLCTAHLYSDEAKRRALQIGLLAQ
jgi:hypothetical protein